MAVFEQPHFGALEEVAVIAVEAEVHAVFLGHGVLDIAVANGLRPGGDVQARLFLQAVELELDIGGIERDVGTALNVFAMAAGVEQRLAVDGDAHQVDRVGILCQRLAVDAFDFEVVLVVEHRQLVVEHAHFDPRSLELYEAGTDDVVGMDEAAAVVFHLLVGQAEILLDQFHRAPRTRARQAEIVAVNHRHAPIHALVTGIADERQAYVGLAVEVGHDFCEPSGVT